MKMLGNTKPISSPFSVLKSPISSPFGMRFKFNPLSWFAAGEQGAWYDPSDLTTLFQDSAGTTPMSAVGTVADQPVGLMLDKSNGLALGAELVTNGTFDVDISGVTQIGGVGIIRDTSIFTTGGLKLTAIQPGDSGIYAQISIPTVVGATYSLSADLYAPATNSASLSCFLTATNTAGTEGINISANGVVQRKTCVFSATSATTLIKAYIMNHGVAYGTTGDVAYYDNISVKRIAGNHAFQATAGNRPMLSARVNLLIYSQDFRNTADAGSTRPWLYSGITNTYGVAIAPDGTTTANYLQETATTAVHRLDSSAVNSVTLGSTAALSITCYFKKGLGLTAPDWIQISTGGASFTYANFNLTTGLVGNYGGGSGISVTNPINVGAGWYRCIVTLATANAGIHYFYPAFTNNTNPTSRYPSYLGIITSDVQAWGADIRPTNAGALLPPYQRVNAASDYDTVGFPLYLKANGTSSAMSTNSIDFSSTDKMTVVTGVRKLSDAAIGTTLELSATSASNNGSFTLTAPNSAAANYAWLSKGTTADTLIATTYAAPLNNVLTGISNISGATNSIRVNGIATSDTNSQGTGNFGNYPLYLFARAGTSLLFNGQFYGAIIRGAQSDNSSVIQTENYMATKTGITF